MSVVPRDVRGSHGLPSPPKQEKTHEQETTRFQAPSALPARGWPPAEGRPPARPEPHMEALALRSKERPGLNSVDTAVFTVDDFRQCGPPLAGPHVPRSRTVPDASAGSCSSSQEVTVPSRLRCVRTEDLPEQACSGDCAHRHMCLASTRRRLPAARVPAEPLPRMGALLCRRSTGLGAVR